MSFLTEPAIDKVVLEKLKVGVQRHVGAGVAQSLQLNTWITDDIYHDLVYSLQAYVLAERLPTDTISKTHVFHFEVPATWFQHLKQSFYSNGPHWLRFRRRDLEKRWPVRMAEIQRNAAVAVQVENYCTYPKSNHVLPEKTWGAPVYVAIPKPIEWRWDQ